MSSDDVLVAAGCSDKKQCLEEKDRRPTGLEVSKELFTVEELLHWENPAEIRIQEFLLYVERRERKGALLLQQIHFFLFPVKVICWDVVRLAIYSVWNLVMHVTGRTLCADRSRTDCLLRDVSAGLSYGPQPDRVASKIHDSIGDLVWDPIEAIRDHLILIEPLRVR
jgi:hypothetical protein